jgi:hypothetical protein
MEDRELTKPQEETFAPTEPKQLSVRMHPQEHKLLMTLLKRDELSFQKLYTYIVNGYLNADPRIIAFVKEQRELERIPKDIRDRHVIPWRERNKLFDEIAEKGKEDERSSEKNE